MPATEHHNLQMIGAASVQNMWAIIDGNMVLIERGRTAKVTAGESLTVRQLVWLDDADAKVHPATNADRPMLGFATEGADADTETYIQTDGVVIDDQPTPTWNWTPGALLYADDSPTPAPGELSETPAGPPVAVALDAVTIWILAGGMRAQVAFSELTGTLGAGQHGTIADGDHSGDLTGNARTGVRKNSAGSTFKRRRVNLIEGSNVTLTVADDAADEEVDVTISTGDFATEAYVNARAATKGRGFYLAAPGIVTAGATRSMLVPAPIDGTITAIKSTARVAASSDYTIDIHKGGTTIYTTQGNRPVRTAAHGTGLATHTVPDVTAIAADDLFTLDVDVEGTDLEDLFVTVYFTEA